MKVSRPLFAALLLLSLAFHPTTLHAQVTISTPPALRQIGMLTNAANSTYGQTLFTPNGINSLDSFSFQLNAHGNPQTYNPNLQFKAYVMGWDAVNVHATGPVLWKSDTKIGPGFYNFVTGGVLVAPNQNIVLFLSTTELIDQMRDKTYGLLMGYGFDDYRDGTWINSYYGGTFAELSTVPWYNNDGCYNCDAAFTATFSNNQSLITPEPSTCILLACGLGMFYLMSRRKSNA